MRSTILSQGSRQLMILFHYLIDPLSYSSFSYLLQLISKGWNGNENEYKRLLEMNTPKDYKIRKL